jgi:hypothetical protein
MGYPIEGASWPKQYWSGRDQLHQLARRARADAREARPPKPEIARAL